MPMLCPSGDKADVRTIAGRPSGPEPCTGEMDVAVKPSKFAEAAEWTGGFADGDDSAVVRTFLPPMFC